ncbi:MAG: PAS domain S-box protein [Candidatus Electrothrix sp. ATG1]|nr:PAS domain S-box protein [Candidatus Electrothrix sp. ATG1]MCI5209391.1 PAS domain S-box protein [Candidatus Electrothrix sp. ATG2]
MESAATQQPILEQCNLYHQILKQLPTPVMAVDKDFNILFMNEVGCEFLGMSREEVEGKHCYELLNSEHCRTPQCRMNRAIADSERITSRNLLHRDGREIHIEYTAAPLTNQKGEVIGGVEFIVDITEKVRQEKRLLDQSRAIQEMSTPAIKLWQGVLVLPVVGIVDSHRAQQMMEAILTKITETSAKVIIMDIQGVAAVDTAVANHLIKITKATKLMGCQCILSGISSMVAQTLVQLGINLENIHTTSTLQDALVDSFAILNYTVTKK